ncbi:MAG TPA: ATP-binding protein, partial [Nitriliruptorales bacterium]
FARQNAELLEAAERERARYAAASNLDEVMGSAHDAMALLDTEGRIVIWNPAMERLTGFAAASAIAQPWFMVLRLRDSRGRELPVAGHNPIEHALTRRRRGSELSLQVLRRDGTWRHVSVRVAPVTSPEGAPAGVMLVAHDRTDEAGAERTRSDFIATASHELRTPLTPLKALLLTLRDRADRIAPSQVEEFAELMLRGFDRLERLVEDLVDLAALDEDAPPAAAEPVRLSDVVEEVVAGLDADRAARVSTSVGVNTLAHASPRSVRRAVSILLDNALVHTTGHVWIQVTAVGGGAAVRVEDEGPGIDLWEQERIFERFERLGEPLTRATQGPGLGLTLARGLARRFGGDVEVESEPGQGATFLLLLPVAAERQPEGGDLGQRDHRRRDRPAPSVRA